MQQFGKDLRVVDVGRRGHHRVDELGFTVDAHVCLHSKVPLIALLGLVHLGVARLGLVLRRGRRIDDRGIDDSRST